MKEEKITCDCCNQVIERYSPTPTYSHVETYPKQYLHSGFVHAVYISPEPQREICHDCWSYIKKFFIDKKELEKK